MSVSVLRLNQRNSQLEAESVQCRHGVSELRAKYEELLLTDASKMAVDEHINTVAALKQYMLALWNCNCFIDTHSAVYIYMKFVSIAKKLHC